MDEKTRIDEAIASKETGKSWSSGKRLLAWTNTIIMTAILLAIIVGVNNVAAKYYIRKDITSEKLYAVSDETKNVLGRLNKDVTVYVYPFLIPQFTREDMVNAWQKARDLLDEYKVYNSRLNIEELTESNKEVLRRLKNISVNANDIIFVCGEKWKTVNIESVYIADRTGAIKTFSAESAFTSTIKQVAFEEVKIYIAVGHNEQENVISQYTHLLARDGYQVESIKLTQTKKVPDDCAALIMVAPGAEVTQDEKRALDEYLKRGGRFFVTLFPDRKCGMEDFLEVWGVHYENNVVLAEKSFVQMPGYIIPERYNEAHPINSKLGDRDLVLPLCCEVEPSSTIKGDEKVRAASLMWLDNGYAESDISFLYDTKKRPQFDPGIDRKGPISLGVAVQIDVSDEKDKGKKGAARLVVLGSIIDINYVSNCLKWLLERENEIAIPPKEFKATPLVLDKTQLDKIFWLSIVVFPSIGIVLGIVAWIMRRK
ncbi:MAG: hypothetical protein A2W23_06175 [Planctomycetes bacterium RBG_16_43_13]|nr:MAG: hypothetical protein A2W23_06175 [Planctomycetes bacterium RBG_16_43_13]